MDDPEKWSPTAAKNLVKLAEWTVRMVWRDEPSAVDDYIPGQSTPEPIEEEWREPMPPPYVKVRFNTELSRLGALRIWRDKRGDSHREVTTHYAPDGAALFLSQVWRSQVSDFSDEKPIFSKYRSRILMRYINTPHQWTFPYPHPYE